MAFELECLHPNQVLNRWTFALENSSTRWKRIQLLKGIQGHRTPEGLTALRSEFPAVGDGLEERCILRNLGQWPGHSESEEGAGKAYVQLFSCIILDVSISKFDLHFHSQSKNQLPKRYFVPSFKSWLSIKWISFEKKCNEMWLVQTSVKFIVLLKSYWVFVYEMCFTVFEV